MSSIKPSLVLLTGASGAGKTSLARRIADQTPAEYEVLFFDSIGIPSIDSMEATHGSAESWQRAATIEWMQRIRPAVARKPVLFEGQIRIAFLREALTLADYPHGSWKIILIDCDDATRSTRLRLDREQPELANAEMMNWARYLRNEASELGIEVLDTSSKSVDASLADLFDMARRDISAKYETVK